MTAQVLTPIDGGIQHIQLNRPEKKNALTSAMYVAIAEAIERAERDPLVRAITLMGSGDSFSSGNDVADFLQRETSSDERPAVRFIGAIARATKPIVAGVNGMAVGIGVTMLLHCDVVYAAETATFQMPFTNLGLAPEAGSSQLLPRLVGYQRAAELMLLGERFSARRACELGLVAAVHPSDTLAAVVRERAATLAAKSPSSVQTTKALLKRDAEGILDRIDAETAAFDRLLESPEAQQIMQAFLARRKAG